MSFGIEAQSPSVATLSRLLRAVSVSELREALVVFVGELLKLRDEDKRMSVSADGKTSRGIREEGDQLRLLHLFSHEASIALDQSEIACHPEEPKAARDWIEVVSKQFPGLEVRRCDVC